LQLLDEYNGPDWVNEGGGCREDPHLVSPKPQPALDSEIKEEEKVLTKNVPKKATVRFLMEAS
jgi:hypothetical protein